MASSASSTRIPASTYRLQFNHLFRFSDATALAPYLSALGITDCYASPYLKAVPGSLHGYDLVDPTSLNPEIGTEEDYAKFVSALKQYSLGQILDVVPNHMGIGKSCNPWWLDVLENGPSSRYAEVFDIDWRPVKQELSDKVLLPILADQYGTVLENQDILLKYDDGRFTIGHFDHRLPIAPKSFLLILTHRLDSWIEQEGTDADHVQELQSIITGLGHLPSRKERNPARVAERYREKEILRRRLAALVESSPSVRMFIDGNIRVFNGAKGDPASFDLLDTLLNNQVYRLAHWRVASEEINYRRFFDINELAAIRTEDPAVFRQSHDLIFRLLRESAVTGLRIDHVDGLYDPGAYLRLLQRSAGEQLSNRHEQTDRPLYIVVEKILGAQERLPQEWPVHGTTGYDFLNLMNGLFVDGGNEWEFEELYARFTSRRVSFEDLAYDCKQLIMRLSMSSEINVLGHQVNRLSERDRRYRDFTLNSLTHTIREIIACFPVYRTYVTGDSPTVTEHDRTYVQQAVARAKRRNPARSDLVFDFVQDLLLKQLDERVRIDRTDRLSVVMKFQQITGPVTAKGIEDTAFYRYNKLSSLNEVGGEPTRFGLSVSEFHDHIRSRRASWPYSLSASSTHDTKRSEDVRARINVLSELPRAWQDHLTQWGKMNTPHKSEVDGHLAPDRNDEYLLYQALIGAWPIGALDETQYREFCDRIQLYMAKALKEAKVHTSWVNPNEAYDRAVHGFIEGALDRTSSNPFLEQFLLFQADIARCGMFNSLAQVLLKIAAPGVPDFYPGTELWDLSLVDPDNRRPVDFSLRAILLRDLQQACDAAGRDRRKLVRELVETGQDGRIKLYLTMTSLHYRRRHAALFLDGEYVPLKVEGEKADHVCAFARIHGDQVVVMIVPRLIKGLLKETHPAPLGFHVWGDTRVVVPSWRHDSRYLNLLTGETLTTKKTDQMQMLPLADILSECPVALLEREG